jgi:UDP-2,3-diacylglucosamine hydrolase
MLDCSIDVAIDRMRARGYSAVFIERFMQTTAHTSDSTPVSETMTIPQKLIIIAGRGSYPRLLAESARMQGVTHISAIAFKHETDRDINRFADDIRWVYLGQLAKMLDALRDLAIPTAVMAGQITPTHLFTVRMDAALISLLRKLPARNADTIFSAIGAEMRNVGVSLLPASCFMEKHMAHEPGILTQRNPTPTEESDMELGLKVAHATSSLEIGQTVVVKEGTILAVEAFEGTDAAILRAGKIGGSGATLIKIAKRGHDMRFDIPVIGTRTVRSIRKAGISAVLVEAGRAILLERDLVLQQLNDLNVTFVVKEPRHD